MGIYDFNSLPEHDKYDAVFTQGQYVDNIYEKNIKYVLYSLSNFWVEVKYHPLNDKIIGIRSFVAGETLNRYSNVPDSIYLMMTKKKLPRWFRIIRYNFNCMWYHVLFPVGMPEDEFSKQVKSK